jgi:hypothetical protein
MKNLFKWVFLIGLLAAVIAGLAHFAPSWFTSLLILVAILAGIFYFDSDDVVHFAIRYIALTVAAVSLDKFIKIGTYLTNIFVAAVNYIGPAVLTVLVVYFIKKYFLRREALHR